MMVDSMACDSLDTVCVMPDSIQAQMDSLK
jgi:hypothetical protein